MSILRRAAALVEARVPFVLATVVSRRAPTSGQLGGKAIVAADGSIDGWVGGDCAQPDVVEASAAALADGQPRMVRIGTDETAPTACESGGALEIHLDPMLPALRVVVVGSSPMTALLRSLADSLDWDVIDEVVGDPATAVVVATHGHGDVDAVRAALDTDAGYVGLVASSKRAHFVLETLRQDGVDEAQLARVHAPAGLDLGPVEHREIAVAIVADLVSRRARGELGPAR